MGRQYITSGSRLQGGPWTVRGQHFTFDCDDV
jgi:hypothetical protein